MNAVAKNVQTCWSTTKKGPEKDSYTYSDQLIKLALKALIQAQEIS